MLAAVPALALAGSGGPGAPVVAADRAFAQAMQRQGEWTAFRAASLPQSEMFVPQRVKVLEFGKDRPDPPRATRWNVEQAWISCDGTVGVSYGRWSLPGSSQRGWYEAIWVQLRGGQYRLLLHRAGAEPRKLSSHPGLKGMRAACSGGAMPFPIAAPDVGTDLKLGASHDQTLTWSSAVNREGALRIVVTLWDGARHTTVLEDVAPAPAPR